MAYQQRQIKASIFRAYDIRGLIGEELDEHAYYSIGRAFACRLRDENRSKAFLGRDGRLSSESMAHALKQGLLDSGIDVVDLGAVSTPVLYFATATQFIDSGLMVTGSHNPADYNGIKMVLAGKTLAQEDINRLYQLVESGTQLHGQGHAEQMDILPAYEQQILSTIHLKRPLKVVVDCGNGIAGALIPQVIERLGCEVIPLHCEVDGRFPNHHPDPSVEENLLDLKQAVFEHQADVGLGFDGDADRLGVVTDSGKVIWPDRLMILYARELLSREKGAVIVYDVKCSNHLAREIVAAGGVAKMSPTGHSLVKSLMKEEQAALAGEMSGHIFFKDRWYGFDDALYSACRLLEILSQESLSASEQFEQIPDSVNTPELKIEVPDHEKFKLIADFCKTADFPEAELITIDGLRVEFPNGWGLLRASNTTPCLVARFEADDRDSLESIMSMFKKQLLELDGNLKLPF